MRLKATCAWSRHPCPIGSLLESSAVQFMTQIASALGAQASKPDLALCQHIYETPGYMKRLHRSIYGQRAPQLRLRSGISKLYQHDSHWQYRHSCGRMTSLLLPNSSVPVCGERVGGINNGRGVVKHQVCETSTIGKRKQTVFEQLSDW